MKATLSVPIVFIVFCSILWGIAARGKAREEDERLMYMDTCRGDCERDHGQDCLQDHEADLKYCDSTDAYAAYAAAGFSSDAFITFSTTCFRPAMAAAGKVFSACQERSVYLCREICENNYPRGYISLRSDNAVSIHRQYCQGQCLVRCLFECEDDCPDAKILALISSGFKQREAPEPDKTSLLWVELRRELPESVAQLLPRDVPDECVRKWYMNCQMDCLTNDWLHKR